MTAARPRHAEPADLVFAHRYVRPVVHELDLGRTAHARTAAARPGADPPPRRDTAAAR